MDSVRTVGGTPDPYYDYTDTTPVVPMPFIIDGVFKYLSDNTTNGILYQKKTKDGTFFIYYLGETVMVYPAGLEVREAPEWHCNNNNSLYYFDMSFLYFYFFVVDSLLTEDSLKAQDIYLKKAIPHTKQQLSRALERYENEQKKACSIQ